MAVEEARRIALHRAATERWGEEVANTLVDLVVPAGQDLATRQDIDGLLQLLESMDEGWSERFAEMDRRFGERLVALDRHLHERLTAVEHRFDDRLGAIDQRSVERSAAVEQRLDDRLAGMEQRAEAGTASLDARWQVEAQGLRHELLAVFERRMTDAVTHQTRTLVVSQLVALVVIAGLAFGLQ